MRQRLRRAARPPFFYSPALPGTPLPPLRRKPTMRLFALFLIVVLAFLAVVRADGE